MGGRKGRGPPEDEERVPDSPRGRRPLGWEVERTTVGRGGAHLGGEGPCMKGAGPISGRSGPILEACDQVMEGWGERTGEALRGGGGSAAGPFWRARPWRGGGGVCLRPRPPARSAPPHSADYHPCVKRMNRRGRSTQPCEHYFRVFHALCPMSWVSGQRGSAQTGRTRVDGPAELSKRPLRTFLTPTPPPQVQRWTEIKDGTLAGKI